MNPYGSFFVRAETGRYGASIDCLEGTIDFADTSIARVEPGPPEPDDPDPDAGRRGRAAGDDDGPGGLAGPLLDRAPSRRAPFAIVPAAQVSPTPTRRRRDAGPRRPPAPKPLAKSAVRSSSSRSRPTSWRERRLRRRRRPCTRQRPGAHDREGHARQGQRQIFLTKAVTYSVPAAGRTSLSLALSKDAKKLLKRKSVSVTVTVTPASGAAITRKVTLKA